MNTPKRMLVGSLLGFLVSVSAVAVAQDLPDGQGLTGQVQRGGQGRGEGQVAANAKVLARVRVPTSHANIQAAPGSGSEILVLAPQGTEMEMVGRRGEWIQVKLIPELRKTGILMRWYKNENAGWMHDSTVQFLTPEQKP
ncbi:MAG: hypothetical protein AB7Q29_16720 [Vicinamibacterales bacterium]